MRTALLSHDMEGRRPDSPPAAAGVIMMMMLEVYGKRPSDKARDLRGYDSAVKARRKRVYYGTTGRPGPRPPTGIKHPYSSWLSGSRSTAAAAGG